MTTEETKKTTAADSPDAEGSTTKTVTPAESTTNVDVGTTSDAAPDTAPDLDGATKLRATADSTDDKAIRRTRTIATIILIILILIILAACAMMYTMLRPGGMNAGSRNHAGITWVRSIYGHGTSTQDLINPSSVIFSADGDTLWVTDSVRHRLVQYDINGRLVSIVNADWRENEMIFPTRIAISPQGWYYVAEQTYNRVQIFDSNFVHQETINIEKPTAVAANDDILAIGSRRGFAVFSYTGEPIGMHAADSEEEINRFDYVHAIAIDDDSNAFVLDSFGNRLVKYDRDGVPQYEVLLGHPGNEGIHGGRDVDDEELRENFPANLQLPQGVTLDGNGRLYIIDMFDFSVAVFNVEDGSFIKKVGSQGTNDGSFHNPNCIDYNPRQDMFASAEASLGRVQLFTIDGSGGDAMSQLRRQFGDFLSACCIPLIIIIIIIAAYLISRYLTRRRREQELNAALADPDEVTDEEVLDAHVPDTSEVKKQ